MMKDFHHGGHGEKINPLFVPMPCMETKNNSVSSVSSVVNFFFTITITLILSTLLLFPINVGAHHVLGRPAYSLNEDSNTPPSMQVETQIGDYFITYMVFPAFPKAGERGRINLYATRIDNGEAYGGEVAFRVKDDVFFGDSNAEYLGSQLPDDSVFRQGFEFSSDGNYIITAEFTDGGEPYTIDFPLRVGSPASIGPLGFAIGVIAVILIGVNLVQRKRLHRSRILNAHEEMNHDEENRKLKVEKS